MGHWKDLAAFAILVAIVFQTVGNISNAYDYRRYAPAAKPIPQLTPFYRVATEQDVEPLREIWGNARDAQIVRTDGIVTTMNQLPPPRRSAPLPSDDERAGSGANSYVPSTRGPNDLPPGFDKLLSAARGQWNGCDKSAVVQHAYGNQRCSSSAINNEFAKQMNRYFLLCLKEGARKAGLPEPTSVMTRHMGIMAGRGNHARGRALDLASVDFKDESGRTFFKFDANVRAYPSQREQGRNAYKDKNKIVYDNFRYCWQRNLPRCRGGAGSIGHTKHHWGCGQSYGGCSNTDHNDHIHLELDVSCGAAR